MYLLRNRYCLALLSIFAVAAVVLTIRPARAPAARAPARKPEWVRRGDPRAGFYEELELTVSAEGGVIDVSATLSAAVAPRDFRHWWFMDVLPVHPVSGKILGEGKHLSYDQQNFLIAKGTPTNLTFHERVPAAPGDYLVVLGLNDWFPTLDQAGNVKAPYHSGEIRSAYVTVR